MKLPPLNAPQRYVGLFVYDFGNHVSVGYTAEEINILRGDPQHAGGTTYRIHRVDQDGTIELQGMTPHSLEGEEALVFASAIRERADADFKAVCTFAETKPLPCHAQLEQVVLPASDLPHVVALIYPSHAAVQVSAWLAQAAFEGGDRVTGGIEALVALRSAHPELIQRCELSTCPELAPRTASQVLGTVHLAVQR